jgi:hypothetical protein
MYLTICCVYQGNLVPKHVGPTIQWAKHSRILRFSDISPTGFRCGLFYNYPVYFPNDDLIQTDKNLSILSTNSSIL